MKQNPMQEQEYIQYIDIDKAFAEKAPLLYKRLPKFALTFLKRLAHQKDLNDDLNELVHTGKRGVPFFSHYIGMKGITIEVINEHNIPKDGKFIFASNHPLGGLDGIALTSCIGKYFPNLRFIVNDLLMHLPNNTAPVFVPVNKHGVNPKDYIETIESVFADDSAQVLYFPAGLVSRKIDGKIQDLRWKKNFITKSIQHKRDVIPVFFGAQNSKFFYNLAYWRKKLGIKANIEMLFLVEEMYKKRNTTFTITFGEKISYEVFDKTQKAEQWADYVHDIVYRLPANK